MINYSTNQSTKKQIENHLLICEKTFIPKLSAFVDIKDYSNKIFNKAVRFEWFDEEKLVGLIAAYKQEELYITNFSTDPNYIRRGIAGTLIKMSEDFCKLNNLRYIELEVRPQNKTAIAFYEKRGFKKNKTNHKNEKELIL